jgi:hypothetical protein
MFFPDLTDEGGLYGYFQQYLAKVHKTGNSMAAKSDVFGDRVISEGIWSLCSPRDFYLWGSLKDKAYKRNSHTLFKVKKIFMKNI